MEEHWHIPYAYLPSNARLIPHLERRETIAFASRVLSRAELDRRRKEIMTTNPHETTSDPSTKKPAKDQPSGGHRAPIRLLLSEGSSLSARQTITALGELGYLLDVCDPNPLCITRFSRFIRHRYGCPAIRTDPLGYLAFVLEQRDVNDHHP